MTHKDAKQQVVQHVDENTASFTRVSDEIWANPELAWKEFRASRLQADFLEKEGFKITRDIGGMNTAFVAEWGAGKPVIAFIGEYDALPALSQKRQPEKAAIVEGAPGHACGHNLLGVGMLAGACAVRKWLEASGTPGVVRYYGCPAEEKGGAKVFLAREGVFDDVDTALNFHPSILNMPSKGSCVAINSILFRFYGTSAHAGSVPHKGRSALDAVELMNVGVNYMREHVKDDVRIHYVITDGGAAPNIVPAEAEVHYVIRAGTPDDLQDVTDRVRDCAKGATLMTGTTMEQDFLFGYSSLLNNHYLADLHYQAMEFIGPITYSDDEAVFAQKINNAYQRSNSDYVDDVIELLKPPADVVEVLDTYRDKPLLGANFPPVDENVTKTYSTDVGDVSWVTPLSMLSTACYASGAVGHSWGVVATGATSIGHKGMLHAAKITAVTAVDLYTNAEYLRHIRQEFERKTGPDGYQCPIPETMQPPRFNPEDE